MKQNWFVIKLNQRPDIVKIYLFLKDPFESKYQLLIYGREKEEIKKLERLKTCTDYSQTIDDYNPTKKTRVLIVFDNMVADMEAEKKLSPIVT